MIAVQLPTAVATKNTLLDKKLTTEMPQRIQSEDSIPQNEYGQRVDRPLKTFDPSAVDTRKLEA